MMKRIYSSRCDETVCEDVGMFQCLPVRVKRRGLCNGHHPGPCFPDDACCFLYENASRKTVRQIMEEGG